MNKYKRNIFFLKISLFFALGPMMSFSARAFSNMCHSPVQLAALMSPNKPQLSKGEQLKKRIKAVDKRIEKYEEKLDDIEEALGDSLSQEKLKNDPYSVAGSVRNYIENNQGGWPCAGNKSSSLNQRFFLKAYFMKNSLQGHFNNPSFLDLIFPTAYANNNPINVTRRRSSDSAAGEAEDEADRRIVETAVNNPSKTAGSGKSREGFTEREISTPQQNCEDQGKVLDETGECVDQNSGKTAGSGKPREGFAEIEIRTPQQNCEDQGKVLDETGECVDQNSGKTAGSGKPREGFTEREISTPQQNCKDQGKVLDETGECKTQDEIDRANCESKGKVWQNGECKTQDEIDRANCESKGKVWQNGECKTQDQIDRANCGTQAGKEWIGGECVCKNGYGLERGNCVKCSEKPGGSWTSVGAKKVCQCPKAKNIVLENGKCRKKTQDEIDRAECGTQAGKEWIGEECVCKKGYGLEKGNCVKCSEKPGGSWTSVDVKKACKCRKANNILENGKCRKKTPAEKCREKGGSLTKGKCNCPTDHKLQDNRCVPKTEQDKCEEKGGMSWVNETCVECPKWKKHKSFRRKGNVDSSFCGSYASDKKACKNALARLARLAKRMEQYDNTRDKLEERLLSLNDSEDTKTEAGGLCFECLKRRLAANRPTTAQTIGNISSMLTGLGLSMVGYHTGGIAQTDANMLRVQQGYPASNDYYSLQGAGAGFPFIANGLYGMTRVNTPVGGWACTPSISPYGHAHGGYGYGYGYQMPYY